MSLPLSVTASLADAEALFDLDQRQVDREFQAIITAEPWVLPDPADWIWNGLTVTDYFCGAGGSSTGLVAAGYRIVLAANHDARAIEVHSANHPGAEHLLADIQHLIPRRLPRTNVLWASPICTELSPAGGNAIASLDTSLLEEGGHVAKPTLERTRVTWWSVLTAAEVHRYEAIIIENVPRAGKWHLLDTFLHGMEALGYNVQFVSASSAHLGEKGNPHAPQWRDRLYLICTLKGIPLPDVEPRPLARCTSCGENVRAVQAWKKPGRHIGEYRRQYIYVCPRPRCSNQPVEPYIAPAVTALDLSNIGSVIGDNPDRFKPATWRRLRSGWETYGPSAAAGDPVVTTARRNSKPSLASEWPLATVTGGGKHTELVIPPGSFISKHHGGINYKRIEHMNKPLTEPLPSIVARVNNSIVIPYRRGSQPYPANVSALSTVATKAQHGVMVPATRLEECAFRMLMAREAANAQRFNRDYWFTGIGEVDQLLAGNAVSCNAAQFFGGRVARVLGGSAA